MPIENGSSINRRRVLQTSLMTGAAIAASSAAARTARAAQEKLSDDAKVILFQGDSITDAGRDRKRQLANDPRSLGRGYPAMAASGLLLDHPSRGLQIHNRGISGNKVPDLKARWQDDCIDLKPDVVSILIGVNDIWHKLNGRYDGTVDVYRDGLQALLQQTAEALPKAKIVVCEPFVLRCGAVSNKWFPEFDQRREAANTVAAQMKLTVVPFQSMFDEALAQAEPSYWAADGVHPTIAGHALMAKTWREVVGI